MKNSHRLLSPLVLALVGCSGPGLDGVQRGVQMFGAEAEPGVVTARIEGLGSTDGQLLVALFRSSDGFPSDQDRAADKASVEQLPSSVGESVWVTFEEVSPGPFAIAAFHDIDGDFELDTNWLGIPTEKWGVSNDAAGWLGPPKFAQAELTVQPGESLEVPVLLGQ